MVPHFPLISTQFDNTFRNLKWKNNRINATNQILHLFGSWVLTHLKILQTKLKFIWTMLRKKYRKFLKTRCFEGPFDSRSQGMEALISQRPNLPEAPSRRQSLIRPWYVVGSSWKRKGYWKGADSPQHFCTSGCKSNFSCLVNFGDWWGSASLWMYRLLSCNQTITCILILFASWWPRPVDWYVWVLSKVRFATN